MAVEPFAGPSLLYRIEVMNKLLFGLLLVGAVGCSALAVDPSVSVSGENFVDAQGRTVVFNGINHVNKSRDQGYVCSDDSLTFIKFRDWGFNLVRYGIIWDRLEPQPGVIDTAYLRQIDRRVRWAGENGIYLLLDMHQDLYSYKWADGAPEWATITDSLPHVTGAVWSDAYMMSPALNRAFDHFWRNTPASDGVGLMDHYAAVWRVVASRYADSAWVVGYDVMNEPFPASAGEEATQSLMQGLGESLPGYSIEMWFDPEKRTQMLDLLSDKATFKKITSGAAEAAKKFDQGPLSTLYQKVRDAVRSVDKRHILFLEHSYMGNMGVPASFLIPTDSLGAADNLVAYAPHAYDLVVDSPSATKPDYRRVESIYEEVFAFGRKNRLPVVVGEWGAYYMGFEAVVPAIFQIDLIERATVGQTYWAYWTGIEGQDYFDKVLHRIYPQATAGTIIAYGNDYDAGRFSMEWDEAGSEAQTRIYLPDVRGLVDRMVIEPATSWRVEPLGGSDAGLLYIEPSGGARALQIIYPK